MPIVDMSVEELYRYPGSTPCPKDFDAYWERALQEMNDTDPRVEMIPADFQAEAAECYDLFFTGVKGARIHAKLLIPKKFSKPCPAILMFHGYTGYSGNWNDKLGYVSEGFVVAFLDCRGQAGLSEDVGGVRGNTLYGQFIRGLEDPDGENLLMRNIMLDTAELAKIVMGLPQVDENRVGAMGASQGGGLTLACASLVPQIKRVAPQYPFLSDYKRVWQMDLDVDAYRELRDYFRMFDPRHEREQEIFEKLGYIDIQNMTKWIRGTVLMATGLLDTICPPSTQFAAYNKITAPKSVVFYPDYGHEWLPDHDDAVFQFMAELKK
ncbi:MAG: acetylxylan esterase [Faecousia sp.]